MTSTSTNSNRLNKQGTGDNPDAWGSVLNQQVFDLIDESLDGVTTLSVNGPVTLTSVNYSTDQSRKRILKITGIGGVVTIPGVSKSYIVHNSGTGVVTIKTSAGAGALVPAGTITVVYCDGINSFVSTSVWPLSNGSVTSPSLYFASDTNTGFYLVASDRIGVACGGTKILDVNMAGVTVTGMSSSTKGSFTSTGYNVSSLTSRVSIGYAGGNNEFGISLRPQANNTDAMVMENAAGVVVGSIVQSAVGTTYNTTSDYRLKNDVADLEGSNAFINALRPRSWIWESTGEPGAGFVAHEVQEVSPTSVHGEKDAVDHDGNPIYQSMQPGSDEIIANLVAAVQGLLTRIAALENA